MTRVSPTRSDAVRDAAPATEGADTCAYRLARADEALVISLDATPREWLAERGRGGVDPAFVATYPHPACVRVVSDLRNPVDVALAAEAFLGSLPDGAAPAVCVDGLARLAERAGPLPTARFRRVLDNRVRAAGGTLHYHGNASLRSVSPTDRRKRR